MTKPLALQGLCIHYTRDERHWQAFATNIAKLGGHAIHTPVLTTRPLALTPPQRNTLSLADDLIFTSANAVHSLYKQYQPDTKQRLVSIGAKTTAAIATHTDASVLTADKPYNSEALLKCYQPQNKHIAIIAAAGGRQLLADALKPHNHVQFIYSYERHCLALDEKIYQNHALPHAITIASCATLDCFIQNCPQQTLKLIQCRVCIVGISATVAEYANALGFQRVIYADNASEQAMISLIRLWWTQQQESSNE